MTLEQVNKELKKVEDEILSKRANDLKLEKEGCRSASVYNFLNNKTEDTFCLSDEAEYGFESFIEALNCYNERVREKHVDKIGFKIEFEEASSKEYSIYVSGNYFYASYKELKSNEEIESLVKSEKRTRLENLLKPEDRKWIRAIDCKLAQLFFDGVIDFKALQKLVYSDCNI